MWDGTKEQRNQAETHTHTNLFLFSQISKRKILSLGVGGSICGGGGEGEIGKEEGSSYEC